jgi:hypothetical protein
MLEEWRKLCFDVHNLSYKNMCDLCKVTVVQNAQNCGYLTRLGICIIFKDILEC